MISFKNIIGKKSEAQKPETKESKKKENIFGQTLNAGMMAKSKKAEYLEAKQKKKAYLRLGVAVAALALYSVFFFYN